MMRTVEPDETRPYYVYVLAYPEGYEEDGVDLSGVVFYVGKGELRRRQSLRDRIDDHEREAELGVQSPKCEAIRKIWSKGLQVQKGRVFHSASLEEALLYERALISFLNANGWLTNILYTSFTPRSARVWDTSGSQGVRESPRIEAPRGDASRPPFSGSLQAELESDVVGMRGATYLLGVAPNTVVRLVGRGELPGFKVGDVWRFYREDIERYIESHMRGRREGKPQ
jgi:excisionase family DNA binding protein